MGLYLTKCIRSSANTKIYLIDCIEWDFEHCVIGLAESEHSIGENI